MNYKAKKVFVFSIFYLFSLFLLVLVDNFLGNFMDKKRKKCNYRDLTYFIYINVIFINILQYWNL